MPATNKRVWPFDAEPSALDGRDDVPLLLGNGRCGVHCAAAWELYVKLLVWWLWFNREFAEWKMENLLRTRTKDLSVHSKELARLVLPEKTLLQKG